MSYKMMTAKQTIDFLFNLPETQREVDFTFDDIDKDPDCDVSGWYGVKLTKIFDETDYVFVMGYWGGGSTEAYDIYGLIDNSDDEDCVKEFCTEKLQNFMNCWCDDSFNHCKKICVEIEED